MFDQIVGSDLGPRSDPQGEAQGRAESIPPSPPENTKRPPRGAVWFLLASVFLVTDIGTMLNHRSDASTYSLALKPPCATVSRVG
jgi:hypothetical protein